MGHGFDWSSQLEEVREHRQQRAGQHLLLALLCETGLRENEFLSLRVSDIDWTTIKIPKRRTR